MSVEQWLIHTNFTKSWDFCLMKLACRVLSFLRSLQNRFITLSFNSLCGTANWLNQVCLWRRVQFSCSMRLHNQLVFIFDMDIHQMYVPISWQWTNQYYVLSLCILVISYVFVICHALLLWFDVSILLHTWCIPLKYTPEWVFLLLSLIAYQLS